MPLQPRGEAHPGGGDLPPRPGIQIAPQAAQHLVSQIFPTLHGRSVQEKSIQLGLRRGFDRLLRICAKLGRTAQLGQVAGGILAPEGYREGQGTLGPGGGEGEQTLTLAAAKGFQRFLRPAVKLRSPVGLRDPFGPARQKVTGRGEDKLKTHRFRWLRFRYRSTPKGRLKRGTKAVGVRNAPGRESPRACGPARPISLASVAAGQPPFASWSPGSARSILRDPVACFGK
jgi:hypothetical protein